MNKLFKGVLRLRDAGLSVIPIKADGSKAAALPSWKPYQERLPNDDELRAWFGNGARPGVALVGGKVSGGLEIIDFDAPELIEEWRELVEDAVPDLLGQLPQVVTPGDGLHVLYRCAEVSGNSKLAQRADGHTLIETRGEGGYVVTAGSPAACHSSGKLYRLVNGDLKAIPEITAGEREILLDCARSFNERVKPEPEPMKTCASTPSGLRPGDDYNERADSRADLERHGWRFVRPGARGELWRRRGKDRGVSATRFSDGSLYVFSSNAAPFDSERAYSPFSIRAWLDYGGDFAATAKALAAEGYGEQVAPKKKAQHAKAEPEPKQLTTGADEAQAVDAEEKTGAAVDVGEGKQSLALQLIKLALSKSKLFHDAGGDAYASVTVGSHLETYKVGSRAHKDWLAALLYGSTQQAARSDTLSDTVTILRAKALYDGPKAEAHVRLAEHDGAAYLDLCDDDWGQVKITESGWDIISAEDSPVRFVRAKGMLSLSKPQRGGDLSLLRDLLNLPEDDNDNWPLIVGWLIAAFRPCNGEGFDYPLLAIHGEQGSGKSSAQRLLRDLIDPNRATLRAAPRDERDLAIAAAHGRIISCDNLTRITEPLSNAFCRLATGGGFATRELFTDEGEVIFDAQRPVVINGIAEVITKSDLLDRAILVYLPAIPKHRRFKKRTLNHKFTEAQPRILGALLDAVSAGLQRMREGVDLAEWPRMSDFAEWVIACEAALGLKDGAFINAYTKNIERADDLAIEASPLAQELLALLDAEPGQVWDGTTGELLKALDGRLEKRQENPKKMEGWPQSARGLGSKLKELAPNLRRLGLDVIYEARGKRGYRLKLVYTLPPPKDPPQPTTDPSGRDFPTDVHHVHHVHPANRTNDLGGEHRGEHVKNGVASNVHPTGNGAAGGEHLDGELFGNVHPNVHPVNGCEQRASVQGEHGVLQSETPESTTRKRVSI